MSIPLSHTSCTFLPSPCLPHKPDDLQAGRTKDMALDTDFTARRAEPLFKEHPRHTHTHTDTHVD